MMNEKTKNTPLKIISLFSGSGGMDIGFESTGLFTTKLCLDNDDDCIETLKINKNIAQNLGIHNYLKSAIIKKIDLSKPENYLNSTLVGKWDVLIGGPPCQSFSVAGNRLGSNDLRGGLIKSYLDCVKIIRPKAFVFENVPGFISIENGKALEYLKKSAKKMGYSFWSGKICAADYGDPTIRVRFIMIAVRNPINEIQKPKITHKPYNISKNCTQDYTDVNLNYITVKRHLN